jgi:hypothetical protein
MSALLEHQARPLFRPRPPDAPEPARRGWWRYGVALALAGYLLFAHGCHGDEDNELFACFRSNLRTRTDKSDTAPQAMEPAS